MQRHQMQISAMRTTVGYGECRDCVAQEMRAEPSVDGRGGLLMRRIHNLTSFGPVFWAGAALPPADERYPLLHKYPLYTEMDKVAKADALEYLSSLVNETVQTGTTPEGKTMTFNERSLYSLPGDSSSLVLLLRQNSGSAGVPKLWASRCTLPRADNTPVPDVPQQGTFSCRSGTGGFEYEIPSRRRLSAIASDASRECNWSKPVATNMDDAPSRTWCDCRLPCSGIAFRRVCFAQWRTSSRRYRRWAYRQPRRSWARSSDVPYRARRSALR